MSETPDSGLKRSHDESDPAAAAAAAAAAAKKTYRRSYKACINCRAKKIKCDLGDLSNPSDPPCARCRREGRKCEFSVSRRGGAGNVRAGRQKKSAGNGGSSFDESGNSNGGMHLHRHGSVGSMTGGARTGAALSAAAVAVASGNMSNHRRHRNADEVDDFGYGRRNSENTGHSSRESSDSEGDDVGENDIAGKELHNTSDALDILAHAARNYPKIESPASPQVPQPESSIQEQKVFQPWPTIADTEVIKEKKFLTEHEAILFINYFFEQLHPFYPFVPEEMHGTDALAQMPILLVVILTISSRYCKFAEKGTKYFISSSRGSQIHSYLWDYCQQLISQTVWAEASTRSIGTVYSFLLISEWNPRAIHWRFNDYANSPRPILDPHAAPPLSSNFTTRPEEGPEKDGRRKGLTPPVNPQTFYPQKLPGDNGFDASKRSDRMSWLLIGTAIRLAQDIGAMATDSNVYVATHLSETVLALRLGRRPMISSSVEDEFLNLEFTPFQQAKLAILKIMSLAHETLYLSRKNTRELLQGGRFLAFLNLFGPHLSNWEDVYRPLFNEPGLERESILFDFHYTRLYIYSLALSNKNAAMPDISNGRPSGVLSDVLSATRYVGIATDAAREMLAIVSRVYEMDKLRLAPIRWIVRAVHAAVFLVKTVLLTPPTSMYLHKATISIIKKTAITLKDSSPDDVHLANRYSLILLNLCDDMTEKYHTAESHASSHRSGGKHSSVSAGSGSSSGSGKGGNSGNNSRRALSTPTVTAVASVINDSMTEQQAPVLALDGLVHPGKNGMSKREYYGGNDVSGFGGEGSSGNDSDQYGLNNGRKQNLNDAVSFEYSRYNGSASSNYGQEMTEEYIKQLQSTAQQLPQSCSTTSSSTLMLDTSSMVSRALFFPESTDASNNNNNNNNNSLEPSYMHFGLGPVAGAAATDSATSFSGTGLPEFNFDFWMEGSEGLGFVDQLVDSMEMQHHRQLMQQRYEKEQQQQQNKTES